MAMIITDNQYYSDIADAIRYKNGTDNTYSPSEMAEAIEAIQTGAEVKLGDVSGVKATEGCRQVILTWTDPNDIVYEETTLAEWTGTLVVRKEGSAPTSKTDGMIVIDSTTRNAYASTGYVDSGLTNGTIYYYRFFPHTTSLYTDGSSAYATPVRNTISAVPSQSGILTYSGSEQSPTWSDYDSTKMTIGGDITGINAGNYTTTFTPADDYQWSDGTITAKNVVWDIGKADSSISLSNTSVTLDSTTGTDSVTVTLSGVESFSAISNDTSIVSVSINGNTITISNVNEASGSTTITVSGIGDGNHNNPTSQIINVAANFLQLVSFSTATDDELTAMVNAYYDGKISLDDVKSVWSVGDSRTIHINAISATGVSESHHADDYEFVILDFDHDTLTTSVNGITKALITIQMKRIMYKDVTSTSYTSSYPSTSEEGGYMNSSNTNSGGWTSCARRTWCNGVFFSALPEYIQTISKKVNKLTSAGSTSSTIKTTSDSVFLLSEIEIFGTRTYSYSGEGSQYNYFSLATANRYKLPAYSTYSSAIWWERSPYSSYSSYFCGVNRGGSAGNYAASYAYGVSPALCI